MRRRRAPARTKSQRSVPRPLAERLAGGIDKAIWWCLAFIIVVVPIFISPTGKDAFRVPKDLLFRGVCIVLAALVVSKFIAAPESLRRLTVRNPVLYLSAGGVAWAAVSTVLAEPRVGRFESLAAVVMVIGFFVLVYAYSADRPLRTLDLILAPAVANALLGLSQALRIWSPYRPIDTSRRMETIALLGNANDLGMYLVPAAIVCWGLLRFSPGRRRVVYAVVLCVILAGLIASQTLTAIASLFGAIVAFLFRRRRAPAIVVSSLIAAIVVTLLLYPPVVQRVVDGMRWLRHGDYDRILSGRVTAFLSALHMARDHPIAGVGPGGFHWHYFDYAIDVIERHPFLVGHSMTRGFNFGEVHSDHLQILAETGIVGYALFAAAVVLFWRRVTSVPLRSSEDRAFDARPQFAQFVGVAFLTSLLLLMVAQFPLNVASTVTACLFIAALMLGWSQLERA